MICLPFFKNFISLCISGGLSTLRLLLYKEMYNMSKLYGGKLTYAAIETDGAKACFTPDGTKFFSSNEQLIGYIRDKCGNDVAACFDCDDDVLTALTELHDKVDLMRPAELLEDIDPGKAEFSCMEQARIREALSIYEAIRSGVCDILHIAERY